ncbi:signal peptide protein [Rhodopirellula maiorica SM1]|uniref:Signal peptide protein n=1 Tax=Rhodopirellula maiorica SM1 TaxID=1265738 RepID=M5RKV0_9BACT|nr:hypothetical protein [Rhodopirellula maiorica]EMI19796.1 signal peptide protein [Rhodopirellula maiorica SM1]
MSFFRRYWAAALILAIVVVHAAVIGYVRSRVARLQNIESNTFDMGRYRFQNVSDPSRVYHFQLHAVLDPSRRHVGRELLSQQTMEIHEEAEHLLRQVDTTWLRDPEQSELRDRMMEIIGKHLEEPIVQRLLITDWLELPVAESRVDLRPTTTHQITRNP